MTRRKRVLWLPALAATLAAEIGLLAVVFAGVRPWTLVLDWHVFHSHHPLQLYLPWLVVLPLVGAATVAWSRSRGASPGESALAALAPALAALGLTVVATAVDLIGDVGGGHHSAEHTFCGTAWCLVSFVLAPGLALALGLLATEARGRITRAVAARAVPPLTPGR